MESPTGVIPEELMHYTFRKQVIAYLQSLPIDGDHKGDLFQGWASWVGTYTTPKEMKAVRESGI